MSSIVNIRHGRRPRSPLEHLWRSCRVSALVGCLPAAGRPWLLRVCCRSVVAGRVRTAPWCAVSRGRRRSAPGLAAARSRRRGSAAHPSQGAPRPSGAPRRPASSQGARARPARRQSGSCCATSRGWRRSARRWPPGAPSSAASRARTCRRGRARRPTARAASVRACGARCAARALGAAGGRQACAERVGWVCEALRAEVTPCGAHALPAGSSAQQLT